MNEQNDQSHEWKLIIKGDKVSGFICLAFGLLTIAAGSSFYYYGHLVDMSFYYFFGSVFLILGLWLVSKFFITFNKIVIAGDQNLICLFVKGKQIKLPSESIKNVFVNNIGQGIYKMPEDILIIQLYDNIEPFEGSLKNALFQTSGSKFRFAKTDLDIAPKIASQKINDLLGRSKYDFKL